MIKTLATLFVLILAADSQALTSATDPDLPASPCPGIFSYNLVDQALNRWYGTINIITETTIRSLFLDIVLDNKAHMLGNWIGEVTTKNNMEFTLANDNFHIEPPMKSIRFFVQYNPLNKPPKVQRITFNGVVICDAEILPPESISNVQTAETKISTSISPEPSSSSQIQCGTVAAKFTPSMEIFRKRTQEGQWPWQIALYRIKSVNHEFTCGGTLVSSLHVITAAHCVTILGTKMEVDKDTLTVYLGKHNLKTTVKGVQIKFVEKIIISREYEPLTLLGDVAILKLHEPVTFSYTVRPACLWPDDLIDLNNVIGKHGSVVGWGLDQTGVLTEELLLLEMPVVSQETCLRSYDLFFSRHTSSKTYCAGRRDGISVCQGDSGGGMVFDIEDRWYLRGLVSQSVSEKNKLTCDPSHYAIFADLAKFLPWIKQNIKVE